LHSGPFPLMHIGLPPCPPRLLPFVTFLSFYTCLFLCQPKNLINFLRFSCIFGFAALSKGLFRTPASLPSLFSYLVLHILSLENPFFLVLSQRFSTKACTGYDDPGNHPSSSAIYVFPRGLSGPLVRSISLSDLGTYAVAGEFFVLERLLISCFFAVILLELFFLSGPPSGQGQRYTLAEIWSSGTFIRAQPFSDFALQGDQLYVEFFLRLEILILFSE